MVSFEVPNRGFLALRGVRFVTTSTAASGAATGRAFEARPVADHGEVAAFRTGITFKSLELRLEGEAKGRRSCLSDRDADDGRLGVWRQSDG